MNKLMKLFLLFSLCSCSQNQPLTQSQSVNKEKEVNKNNSLIIIEKASKPIEKPDFKVVKPVVEGVNRSAYISLFFKDDFKIRLDGLDYISFKSLTNKNVSKINDLLVKYNTKKIEANEFVYLKSEEELEKEEKASEKYYGIDYPNKGSIYSI